MSKRDNKRFNDQGRKSAPKRGGKNRRDYGDNYEPRRRTVKPRTAHELFGDVGRQEQNVGADGLEIVAGRNPVTEALNGDRDVERVFIADGAEGVLDDGQNDFGAIDIYTSACVR